MEARELRQGNIVGRQFVNPNPKGTEICFEPVFIKEIREASVNTTTCLRRKERYVLPWTNIQPIPLSEDWLKRFGFDFDGSSHSIENENFTFKMLFYDCWNISYHEKKGYGGSECLIQSFPEVHQMQNLYFALTGTELTLKP